MVQVNPYSALSNLGQSSSSGQASIADNFDTFLTLLTTQLRHQNPLDPLDMNQFTQQLVQFSEVEQSVKLNKKIEQMVQLSAANAINGAVSFIGKEVTTSGTSAQLRDGRASWTVTLAQNSPSTTFVVKNAEGVPVFTQTGPAPGGSNVFNWDGKTDTGVLAQEGQYTLEIIAQDDNGKSIEATTAASGVVDGVDMSGDEPMLLVSGWRVPLSDIISINTPPPSTPGEPDPEQPAE